MGELRGSDTPLASDFESVSLVMAHAHRAQFLSYLDEVRLGSGANAAIKIINAYVEAGILPALAALAGQTLARRENDYILGVELAGNLRVAFPRDAFVASSHMDSLLAAGQLGELAREFESIRTCQTMRYTDDTALRLAATAAISGSWDDCDYFLGIDVVKTPSSEWKRLSLAARINFGREFEPDSLSIPTTIISLPGDDRKFELARSLYQKMNVNVNRLNAVRGSELSRFVLRSVLSASGLILGPGAVGCALSHIAAWERIAAGADGHGLVIEDDGLPYSWQSIDALVDRAGEFDVLYVNERMSSIPCQRIESGYSSVWDTLGSRPPSLRGWGGDGYIVSKRGSEKLLDLIGRDKIVGHIDGQIGSYGVVPTQQPTSRAQAVGVACRANMISQESLLVKCLRFPLVTSSNFGHSSIVAAGGHQ